LLSRWRREDAVVHAVEHALDLVIAAFMESEAGLAFGEDLELGGQGGEVFGVEVEARAKASTASGAMGSRVSTR